jgi:hypothetical protein
VRAVVEIDADKDDVFEPLSQPEENKSHDTCAVVREY